MGVIELACHVRYLQHTQFDPDSPRLFRSLFTMIVPTFPWQYSAKKNHKENNMGMHSAGLLFPLNLACWGDT